MNKKLKQTFFYVYMTLFSSICLAIDDYSFSESEAKQLPPFCLGLSIGNFQDNAKHLRKEVKSPAGSHNHHFCHGMKSMLRQDYSTAIQEFEYVQTNSGDPRKLPQSYYLILAATSLYKAEAMAKLGNPRAIEEYNKAIQLKPKYPQAYAKLADYYSSRGMKDDALETIKLGIKYSPNSKALNKRLQKIQQNNK
ncbi:MAG: tetratricopeptide repeat protein [Methylococcaceae bacterium]|nr:tetratricopeptide repeat protein [Methylococcaceae bacterium]MDP3903734.1 tetratricopeptide repeat protein [Methylococcaceae bacterium]